MSLFTLTEQAKNHFKKLILQEGTPNLNLRIEISNPGTSKAEIELTYCPEYSQDKDDFKLDFNEFKIYVDKHSIEALQDANIDFVTNDLGGELVFKAPHIYGKKIDKNMPLLEQIKAIVKAEINPVLANHSGSLTVCAYNEQNGELQIEFNGGCQGCGMAKVTMNDYIEKVLLKNFPDHIKVIRDVTNHGY